MRSYLKPLSALFIFIHVFTIAFGQENVIFHRFTTQDGLCFEHITNVLKDKKGFLWIGTVEGLSRYDGSRFLNFTHDYSDSTSVNDNYISSLACNKDGTLWVSAYSGGISKFDEASHTFNEVRRKQETRRLIHL